MGDNDRVIERLRRRALKENRADDANIDTIRRRLGVYERETKPVLDFYPPAKVVEIDATMSQIRVLSAILGVLVPLKESARPRGRRCAPREVRPRKVRPREVRRPPTRAGDDPRWIVSRSRLARFVSRA